MLKAIDTSYAGHRFRSRTEARWAVFLDALGVAWTYEEEGFELPSGRYLPDFWLPDLKGWIEVKGKAPTREERAKLAELIDGSGHSAAIVTGPPSPSKADALFRCMDYARPWDCRSSELSWAFEAASSARFEFGEGASRHRPIIAPKATDHAFYAMGGPDDDPVWVVCEASERGGGIVIAERWRLSKYDAHAYALLAALFCGQDLLPALGGDDARP